MTFSRRKFVKRGLAAGAGISLVGSSILSCTSVENQQESKKLNILILGGTSFLGPHQIAYALERGHSISTFTRGKSMPTVHADLLDKVEMLIGDRENNLEALKNRKWDVVIDNSGRNVQWTEDTAALLKDNVGLYMYTSSTGVYYPYLGSDITEDTKLHTEMLEGLTDDEIYEMEYGVMKTNSELAAIKHFGADRTIVVRPTYMIGPGDRTDRFIHWPIRLSMGGNILVPGKTDDPVQFMDVRDVAQWMIRMAENSKVGAFNAVGPKETMDVAGYINEAKKSFDVDMNFVHVDDYDFLKEQGIYYLVPWVMVEGKNYGSSMCSNAKAKANGLTFTPLVKTMQDIYEWWRSDAVPKERTEKYENDPNTVLAREAEILKAWKERNS